MLQAEALLAGLEARDDSIAIVMLHAGRPCYRRIGSLAYGVSSTSMVRPSCHSVPNMQSRWASLSVSRRKVLRSPLVFEVAESLHRAGDGGVRWTMRVAVGRWVLWLL